MKKLVICTVFLALVVSSQAWSWSWLLPWGSDETSEDSYLWNNFGGGGGGFKPNTTTAEPGITDPTVATTTDVTSDATTTDYPTEGPTTTEDPEGPTTTDYPTEGPTTTEDPEGPSTTDYPTEGPTTTEDPEGPSTTEEPWPSCPTAEPCPTCEPATCPPVDECPTPPPCECSTDIWSSTSPVGSSSVDGSSTAAPSTTKMTGQRLCDPCVLSKCPSSPWASHVNAPGSCSQFCKCDIDRAVLYDCPNGLHFNAQLEVCDWPVRAQCTIPSTYLDGCEKLMDAQLLMETSDVTQQ